MAFKSTPFRYAGNCRNCGKRVTTVTVETSPNAVVFVRCSDCDSITTAPESVGIVESNGSE